MITDFPFFNVGDEEFFEFVTVEAHNNSFGDPCTNHVLQDYLFDSSKNLFFKLLDTSYYTSDEFIRKSQRCRKQLELSIFHLNIRCLNSKHRELCIFIDLLETEFDVLVLSEVWSHNLEFYGNIFHGYSFYYDPPKNSTIGGIGMYIKKNLLCKARLDLALVSKPDLKIENLWFEISKNRRKYLIGGIYRHPGSNFSIPVFSQELELTLNKISCGKTPCLLPVILILISYIFMIISLLKNILIF